MNDEDIKRIEKKIDLLYRMRLADRESLSFKDYLHELIPLFNLSVEMKKSEELNTREELLKMRIDLREKIDKMKEDLNDETISVKESNKLHQKLPTLIYQLEEKYNALLKIEEDYNKDAVTEEEFLMVNLKEKLGVKLSEEYDFIHKKTLERKFKEVIGRVQSDLERYKEEFN